MSDREGAVQNRSRSPTVVAALRGRIRGGMLISQLEKHVEGKLDLSNSQVNAALGLLRKVVPDLASFELKSTEEKRYVITLPSVAASTDEWQRNVRERLRMKQEEVTDVVTDSQPIAVAVENQELAARTNSLG